MRGWVCVKADRWPCRMQLLRALKSNGALKTTQAPAYMAWLDSGVTRSSTSVTSSTAADRFWAPSERIGPSVIPSIRFDTRAKVHCLATTTTRGGIVRRTRWLRVPVRDDANCIGQIRRALDESSVVGTSAWMVQVKPPPPRTQRANGVGRTATIFVRKPAICPAGSLLRHLHGIRPIPTAPGVRLEYIPLIARTATTLSR